MKNKKENDCPLVSLEASLNFDARDWSLNKRDAWIYGIIAGWDDALDSVAKDHGWNEETVERLKELHFKFNGLKHIGDSSSDLKSEFMGEFSFEEEHYDEEGNDYFIKKIVPWTTTKEIFAKMSNYVKSRSSNKYRP